MGRRIFIVGRGREVARLSGIDTDRAPLGRRVASEFPGPLAGML